MPGAEAGAHGEDAKPALGLAIRAFGDGAKGSPGRSATPAELSRGQCPLAPPVEAGLRCVNVLEDCAATFFQASQFPCAAL